jgi:starch synthase
MPHLSPAYDNKIARKYSARTVEHKAENKKKLQEDIGWIPEPKQPIICFPAGMTDALGGELMQQVLPGILELPVCILIRGRGSNKYGEIFTKLSKGQAHRVSIIPDDEAGLRTMLAGSDIAMYFSKPQDPEELETILRYGVIPVAPECDTLDNYNPVQESGNAFTYEETTAWQCFASLVRALETFKFPYDWRTIQRHAMEAVERKTEQAEARK